VEFLILCILDDKECVRNGQNGYYMDGCGIIYYRLAGVKHITFCHQNVDNNGFLCVIVYIYMVDMNTQDIKTEKHFLNCKNNVKNVGCDFERYIEYRILNSILKAYFRRLMESCCFCTLEAGMHFRNVGYYIFHILHILRFPE
jgi:hypothetical protein